MDTRPDSVEGGILVPHPVTPTGDLYPVVMETSERVVDKKTASAPRLRRRHVRISFRWLVLGGAVLGVVAGLSICLAGNYVSILVRQARDAYVVYRLTGERDELRATKVRLERELVAIRSEKDQNSQFESVVKGRLDELASVVEASTALGIFRGGENGRAGKSPNGKSGRPSTSVLAKNSESIVGEEPSMNALASLLDSPVLTGRGARAGRRTQSRSNSGEERGGDIDDLRSKNRGLGGAEIECHRDRKGHIVCESTATSGNTTSGESKLPAGREDVAFSNDRASLSPTFLQASWQSPMIVQKGDSVPVPESWTSEQRALLERVNRQAMMLKSLPIGLPVVGEMTSGFGYRVSPFTRHSSFHEGVDISLERGTRIRSPGDGLVVKVGFDGTYGWMVDVAHPGLGTQQTVITRYAHLSRAIVREGQRVRRGQVLALSGSSGRSTGPHLHYEVRVGGRARNPMPFIALADKLARVLS